MPSYRIRNWPEYNRALKNRGNLTLWVSDDAIAKWLNSTHTCQKGRPRIFTFGGQQYYLAVCYDGFGMKRVKRTGAPVIHGIINLVHFFTPPRNEGAGAGYFARYGFAGASKAWQCPVYAAVRFGGPIQENWPTGVLWDQGDLDAKRWTYRHNPLRAEAEHWLEGSEPVRLAYHPIGTA